jgi:transposase
LDVHARSVVAGMLDGGSGELRTQRVPARSEETVAWLEGLDRPVRVAHEAGRTGSGLARACAALGIVCTVAAPRRSRARRVSRTTTDRRDAERLPPLGEWVGVRVPEGGHSAAQEAGNRARINGWFSHMLCP